MRQLHTLVHMAANETLYLVHPVAHPAELNTHLPLCEFVENLDTCRQTSA